MFEGTDTAARRIWSPRPYVSYFGKSRTMAYTSSANSIPFCQTTRFLKLRATPPPSNSCLLTPDS